MLESIVRSLRNNLELFSGNPSIRSRARRVESLWNKGRREQSQALAESIFREHEADPRVVIFYTNFLFEKIGERERAMEVAAARLASAGAPMLLFQLHRLCKGAGNCEFLLSLSKTYFQHPKLAGPAFLAYGSALFDTTGDFGLAAGFFNRAAIFGRLGRHSDPAELAVSPKAFTYLADLPVAARALTLEKPRSRPELVVAAAGDREALRTFSQQRRNLAVDGNTLLHFHAMDPRVRPKLEREYSSGAQVFLSFEEQADESVKPELRLFELLPLLLEHYECPVLLAGEGFGFSGLMVLPVATPGDTADLAVSPSKSPGFPWQTYSSCHAMFRPTDQGLRLSRALRTFLLQTPAAGSRRYLLPLAIAECVHTAKSAGGRVFELPGAIPVIGKENSWP